MKCHLCPREFDFRKGQGVNYRSHPLCDECLMNIMFICVDKNKEGIKRYLKAELKLQHYSE